MAEAEGDGEPLALVMIDIDHFKQVNDVHGHPVGDEVLLEVAKLVVNRTLRKGSRLPVTGVRSSRSFCPGIQQKKPWVSPRGSAKISKQPPSAARSSE